MTYTPIAKGTTNWDVPLNAALAQLDATITSNNGAALKATNNLSDLTSIPQARTNLGLSAGTAAGVNNFNVKDYGALGNNVADDTAAINSAITAANANGGIVYFPPGLYKVNSGTGFIASGNGVTIQGSGAESTQIVIGSGFTGTSVITFTGNNGVVRDISVDGASSTTTSNPAVHAITVSGARRLRVDTCQFWYVNGYAVRALATNGSSTTNPHGTIISNTRINQCAGGIYFLGNTTQGYAVNSFVSNVHIAQCGVTTGGNANLDGIRVEDAWDVLLSNNITWMSAGTGSALHVKGNCAATFVQNLDALGPTTAPNVLIEDGANGSVQNVQISGGVIQQGSTGVTIAGASNQIRLNTVRIINNQTHGISVTSTGFGIILENLFYSLNGAGASGNNYEINWSGTATGHVLNNRFGTAITSTGVAGVQQSINVAASQNVRVLNADFQGTGASSSNWFTSTPSIVTETSNGKMDFFTTITAGNSTRPIELQPSATGNTALAVNINGTDANDRLRILGSGQIAIGPGNAARDTNLGRAASGILYTDKNLLVGSATALGDNGVGEIQVANVTTAPTTNPTNGVVMYAESGSAAALKIRDTSGNVRGLVDGYAIAASDQTTVSTSQVASTQLVIPVQANATYIMDACLFINNTSGISFVHSWTGPTGATMVWGDIQTKTKVATITGTDSWTGSGVDQLIGLTGVLVTSSTAGNLTVTFATGNASNTATLRANSYVRLARVK